MWKKKAETETRAEASSRPYQSDSGLSSWQDEEDLAQIADLGLAAEDTIDQVVSRLNAAASRDVDAFKRRSRWPQHPVELGVRSDGIEHSMAMAGLANLLGLARAVTIVSAPGTGKSTTLIQLASTLLEDQRQVAVIAPLAAWSTESVPLLKWVTGRSAFHGVRVEHLMLLAIHGRLTLLLDGWNELDSQARQRLIYQIEELESDYPLIRLAVSTRRQRTDVPVGGSEVRLDLLSYSQQLEIARARREKDGEALLDRARRTAGIRELIAIPLYLDTLLAEAVGDRLPNTKEEVLRLFVENHESKPARAEILRGQLLNLHRSFLQALAVDAMVSTTALTGERARSVISNVQERLRDRGQIGIALQPSLVLDLLVDHELLVRVGQESFSFQHPQFQEWHASFEVERLARAAEGDAITSRLLLENILNLPVWEEAILFACERMAFADSPSHEPVGRLILQSLAIDPLFAAEMIFRASESVWAIVKNDVVEFAKRWHSPGQNDRALRFMMATGRKEFAAEMWQIISNPRNQDGFGVINTSCPFRPSVLGDDWPNRVATLAEEPRESLLCGIVRECGVDEMERVTGIVKSEVSVKLRKAVLQALLMRGATRQVTDLLSIDDPELWQAFAGWVRPEEVSDEKLISRLRLERERLYERTSDPRVKLYILLESQPMPASAEKEVAELIKSDFASNNDRIGGLVTKAFKLFPRAVSDAMLDRLRQGRSLTLFEDVLQLCPLVEDEAVANLLLDPGSDDREAVQVARIAGPITVGRMLDYFLALAEQQPGSAPSKARTRAYFQMRDRLGKTRVEALLEEVLKRQNSSKPDEIGAWACLLSLHGLNGSGDSLESNSSARSALAGVIPRWVDILIGSSESLRADMAYLAMTIGRLRNPELVPALLRLLDEDARRQRLALEASRSRTGAGALNSEAITSWSRQYNQALAEIGDEQVVVAMRNRLAVSPAGVEAAQVLSMIWARPAALIQSRWPAAWPDYSEVARLQTRDGKAPTDLKASFAAPILDVFRTLDLVSAPVAQQLVAIQLLSIALRMPCGEESALIDSVIALPVSARAKTELLTSVILAGKILAGRTVLNGIEEIARDAKKEPWLLDQNTGLIERWLEFFPFTDGPSLLLDALKMFSPGDVGPWRLRGVIAAISVAPIENRESLLRQLAEQDGRFYSDNAWLEAILHCSTAMTRARILDDLAEGKLTHALKSGNAWRFARDLVKLVIEDPTFRAQIYERLDHLQNENIRPLLVQVVIQTPDIEGFFVLLRSYAAKGHKLDTKLLDAIDGLVMTKRYFSGSNNAYELHAVDASALRTRLFATMESGGQLASLAAECLEAIDEMRDRHGRLESEPRHPDIASHRPWPPVARWIG